MCRNLEESLSLFFKLTRAKGSGGAYRIGIDWSAVGDGNTFKRPFFKVPWPSGAKFHL